MHGLPDLLADRCAPVDLAVAVFGRDLLEESAEAFFELGTPGERFGSEAISPAEGRRGSTPMDRGTPT
jgi:hypothetical protein